MMKMTYFSNVLFMCIVFCRRFSSATKISQSDCEKFCYGSCQQYFPGSEFSLCVQASTDCSCYAILSIKNPLVICGLVFAFILFLCLGGVAYGCCKYPIVPVAIVGVQLENVRRPSNISANAVNAFNSASQLNSQGCINPQGFHELKDEISSEYMKPPPYNQYITNENSRMKMHRF